MTATPVAIAARLSDFAYAIPEIALAVAPLLVVAWDLWAKGTARRQTGAVTIALVALAVSAMGSAAGLLGLARLPVPVVLFGGQLACDGFACAFRLFFALVTAFVVVAAIPRREAKREAGGELFALLLFACLGMNLMAMGRTLLLLYMAIEMVSVVSFVLVTSETRKSSEAALKYVLFGGVASAVMVYGMSWLYGVGQSLDLSEIAERVATVTREQGHLPNAVTLGVACVLAGLAYKIGAAPFHMWAPDAYEGAPTLVAAFLSVGPTAAGVAALLRFFRGALEATAVLPESQAPWPVLLGGIAVATMTLGNLCALGQTNLKRMLAYSSIAHAGTMLLAFSVPGEEGVSAITFYLVPYCAMNLGAFLVVLAVSEGAGGGSSSAREAAATLDGVRGLGTRSPAMAAAFAVFLLSLVGLPPFAGFAGKLYVLLALVRPITQATGDYRSWYFFLAAAGVGNTVVSFFYYARVLRSMYLEGPLPGEDGPVSVRRLHGIMTTMLVVPTLVLGVSWGPLYAFVTRTMTLIR